MKDILEQLLADGVIDEVLGRLKSGKEADVFLVRHRGEIVVAKVYKDRQQRSFKSNAVYKEGRQIRNSRTRRAVEKGSRFGQREAEEAWKSAEADALYRLHAEGVAVPTPKMFYEGVLLMELVTDADGEPAPRLMDAPIAMEAAAAIYRDVRRAIVGMLCCDLIHGDLSPYNVLLAADGATVIDFPQMMSAAHNNRSEFFFRRDFENIHRFLSGIDRSLQRTRGEGFEIWRAYLRRELTPDFVPSGMVMREERRPPPPQQPRPQRTHPPPQTTQPSQPSQPRYRETAPAPPPQQPRAHLAQPPRPNNARSGGGGRSGPRQVSAPEVVYVRRPGQPPPVHEQENRAAPPPRENEPPPHRAPHAPHPPRAPSQPQPSQHHRQQHRAPHQNVAPPPPRFQPPQNDRGGGPAPEQGASQAAGSERKGPRRRRRGRRWD
jgi:RIO kinase 1